MSDPRKGTIAVGSDADLVVWETGGSRTIRDGDLYPRAAPSVYAGRTLTAWPRSTVRRGEVVFEDAGARKITAAAGSGRVAARGPFDRPAPTHV